MLGTRDGAGGARGRDRDEERSHAFWETQPVMQFREDPSAAVSTPPPPCQSPSCGGTWGASRRQGELTDCPSSAQEQPEGPIDDARDLSNVRQQPYNLPAGCGARTCAGWCLKTHVHRLPWLQSHTTNCSEAPQGLNAFLTAGL